MWRVELIAEAREDLRKIDPRHAREIAVFLKSVMDSGQPRAQGSALSFLWRYEVATHQVIVAIDQHAEKVFVTHIRPASY